MDKRDYNAAILDVVELLLKNKKEFNFTDVGSQLLYEEMILTVINMMRDAKHAN